MKVTWTTFRWYLLWKLLFNKNVKSIQVLVRWQWVPTESMATSLVREHHPSEVLRSDVYDKKLSDREFSLKIVLHCFLQSKFLWSQYLPIYDPTFKKNFSSLWYSPQDQNIAKAITYLKIIHLTSWLSFKISSSNTKVEVGQIFMNCCHLFDTGKIRFLICNI